MRALPGIKSRTFRSHPLKIGVFLSTAVWLLCPFTAARGDVALLHLPTATNATTVGAAINDGTLEVTLDGGEPATIDVIDGMVKVNGADPASGPMAAAACRKIELISGPEPNLVTVKWTDSVEQLAITAPEASNDTIAIDGDLDVTGLLSVTAPFIKSPGVRALAAGKLKSQATAAAAVLAPEPQNEVAETSPSLAAEASAATTGTANTENRTELAALPKDAADGMVANPEAESSTGILHPTPPAVPSDLNKVVATRTAAALTLTLSGEASLGLTSEAGRLLVNGADPASGAVPLTGITQLLIRSDGRPNRITVKIDEALANLTIKAAADSNDTIDLQGALTVSGPLAIDAPSVQVNGNVTAGRIAIDSITNVRLGSTATLRAMGGDVALHSSGDILLRPGSAITVSPGVLGGKGGAVDIRGNRVGAAGRIVARDGKITVHAAGDGFSFVDGLLNAASEAGKGGTVEVTGNGVVLTETARVDVSGETGGGTVLIGGDARGKGAMANALHTVIAPGAFIDASARTTGDGGRVVIWSDDSTPFRGNIAARGGTEGGNGGAVEVSGKGKLTFEGKVDLEAPKGKQGQIDLDPLYVVVLPTGASIFLTMPDDFDWFFIKSGVIKDTGAVIGQFFCELFGGDCNLLPTDGFVGDLDVLYTSRNVVMDKVGDKVKRLWPLRIRAAFSFVDVGTLEQFTGNMRVQSIFGIALLYDVDETGALNTIFAGGGDLDLSNQQPGETVRFETIGTIVVMGDINVNGAKIELVAGNPFDLDVLEDMIIGFIPGGTAITNVLQLNDFLHNLNVTDLLKGLAADLINPNDKAASDQALDFLNELCNNCIPANIGLAVLVIADPINHLESIDDLLVALGLDVPGWVSDFFSIAGDIQDNINLSPRDLYDAVLGGIDIFPDFYLFHIPGLCDVWDDIPCSMSELISDVVGPLLREGIDHVVKLATGKSLDDIAGYFNTPLIIPNFSLENSSYPPLHLNNGINNPRGPITLENDSLGSVSFNGPLVGSEVHIVTPRGPIRNTRVYNRLTSAGAGNGQIVSGHVHLDAAGGIGQIHGFGPNSDQLGFLGSILTALGGGSGFQFVDGGAIPYLTLISPETDGRLELHATNKGSGGIFFKATGPLDVVGSSSILNKNEAVSDAWNQSGSQEIILDSASTVTLHGTLTNERGGGAIKSTGALAIVGTQAWSGDTSLEARNTTAANDNFTLQAQVTTSGALAITAADAVALQAGSTATATGATTVIAGGDASLAGSLGGTGLSVTSGGYLTAANGSSTQAGTGPLTLSAGKDLTLAQGAVAGGNSASLLSRDNIVVAGALTLTNHDAVLQADENIDLQPSSTIDAGTGNIILKGDIGDTDATGSNITINGVVKAARLTATGGNNEDTFYVAPSVFTPIFIDGSNPTVRRGDVLEILNPDGLTMVQGLDKTITMSGRRTVTHTNIESIIGVPPTVSLPPGATKTINESGLYTSSASFIDFGADSWTARINYGDGSAIETIVLSGGADGNGPFPEIQLSHIYGDNGNYTVTVQVIDNQDQGMGSASAVVTVNNLNPTLYLLTSTATVFPGGNAYLARTAENQSYLATGGDPGSDDLTFAWSHELSTGAGYINRQLFGYHTHFNNGTSADPLPSGPGIFPYFTAVDNATVAFGGPGIYRITTKLFDDDYNRWPTATGLVLTTAPVVVTDSRTCPKARGYWQHQFKQEGHTDFDAFTLERYLDIIKWASRVFPAMVPLNSLADAEAILHPEGPSVHGADPDHKKAKAIGDTFVAWLNWASGGVLYTERLKNGLVFHEAMTDLENILLNPASTKKDFENAHKLAGDTRQTVSGKHCPDGPANMSLTPSAAATVGQASQAFTAVYYEPNEMTDLDFVAIKVSDGAAVPGLTAKYVLATNQLYLLNDAGTDWIGGYAPGSAHVMTNALGSINCAPVTVVDWGDRLQVTWNFVPATSLVGTMQTVSMYMQEVRTDHHAGWDAMGAWSIVASTDPDVPPSGARLSSIAARSDLDTVTLTFSAPLDPNLAGDAGHYTVSRNGGAVTPVGVAYNQATNAVVISLARNTLHVGDQVTVRWSGLRDVQNRPLADGSVSAAVAR